MQANDLASVERFLYSFYENISFYSFEGKLPLEYCKHKLKYVILNLFLKKGDSFDVLLSLGTRSPYRKGSISII